MNEAQEIIKNIKDAVAAGNTIIELLEKQPEHVWKHGDVGDSTKYNSGLRLFVKINGILKTFNGDGNEVGLDLPMILQKRAENYKYKFLGNIFDGTYKP